MKDYKKKGLEPGLHMVKFSALQCGETYIDKALGCEKLGVKGDDIEAAIADSMILCKDIIENRLKAEVMRAE